MPDMMNTKNKIYIINVEFGDRVVCSGAEFYLGTSPFHLSCSDMLSLVFSFKLFV
jgi:hypothetical protein